MRVREQFERLLGDVPAATPAERELAYQALRRKVQWREQGYAYADASKGDLQSEMLAHFLLRRRTEIKHVISK